MDKSKLLDQCGALGEDRTLLARVLDRAKQASERNIPAATDFLSPAQQAQAADLLHAAGIPETAYIRWGGYDGAERAVLLFLPDWMDPSDAGTYSPIRCLRAAFRKEENLTHRDFLGSLMGMGIVREKIGDILVGPDSADVLVLDTVAEFLAQSWESAGRVKLRVAEIDPGCVHIPEIRREERRGSGGYSFLGGVGLATVGHQEIIRKRAAEGWRFAGWIPVTQRAGGFIETIDLVFERETAEKE